MAPFIIKRSRRLPPAVGPNVRARIDTDIGAGAIGRALTQAGGALAGIGAGILQKKRQMEDSIGIVVSQQLRENSRQNQLTFRNSEADQDLWGPNIDTLEATDIAAQENIKFGTPEQRQLSLARLTAHYSDLRTENITAVLLKTKNDMLRLTKGAVVEAWASGDAETIAAAEANFLAGRKGVVNTALANQELTILREAGLKKQQDKIAEIAFNAALALPFEEGVKTINATTLPGKRKLSMITGLRREQKFRAQKMVKDFTAKLHTVQISDVSPQEKRGQYAGIAEQIKLIPGITPAELRTSLDRITLLQSGSDVKTDFPVWQQVMTRLRALNSSSSAEQIDDAREFLTLSTDKLSIPDAKAAQNYLDNLLDKDKAQAIKNSVDLAIQGGQITKDFDEANYTIQLQEWVNKNQDKTAADIQAKGAEIAAGFDKTPARIFTPARIEQTLGALASKSTTDIFGRARITLTTPEKAITFITKELGPNWQFIAPRAVDIIKRHWPDAKIPPIDVIPAPPPGVPSDAKWDANRQMWTWRRDGRLKGWEGSN